ncbi:MAG: DUF6065 family protein [Pseudomonadota bacterium]
MAETENPDSVAFLCSPELEARLPKPEPAGRFTPDWFRQMERKLGVPMADGLPGLTVKACLPVTDAFAAGWIIPLAADVTIEVRPDGSMAIYEAEDAPFQQITAHAPAQVGAPNPPFGQAIPLKWMLPWRVRAPEGVSLLYTQPLNHFELPFFNFTGLVDADRFGARVNAPFVWARGPGSITLPAGTPIVQIVPLSRKTLSLDAQVRAARPEEAGEEAEHTRLKHSEESVYARRFRVRK